MFRMIGMPRAQGCAGAALSWAQRLKRVFAIDIETCPDFFIEALQ
jgi:hypothetical protein